MSTIGSLLIKILGDASNLRAELGKASQSTAAFERAIEKSAKVGLTALVGLESAMVAMTIVAGQQAEALEHLSMITGINTDTLQEYDVLLNRVGLGAEDLTTMMRTLSKSMEEAKLGTGTAADRFRQLGIDINKIKGTDDAIRKIADATSRMSNGMEKAAIMTDLAGRSALKLIPAFEGGAKGIDAAAAASKDLGATMGQFHLDTLGSMDNAVDDLWIAWKRFGQQLGVVFAPAIELAAKGLTAALAAMSHWMQVVDKAADILAIQLTHLAVAAGEIASVVFSKDVASIDAWVNLGKNLKFINKEMEVLIANRRAMTDNVPVLGDTRKKAPPLVDSAKAMAQAQSMLDAQFKLQQQYFKDTAALNKADLAQQLATLDAAGAAGIRTVEEISLAKKQAIAGDNEMTMGSLIVQLSMLESHNEARKKLFTNDAKGVADRAKFEVEAQQKVMAAVNELAVAMKAADTAAITGGQQVLAATKTMRLQPLEDAVNLAKADFDLQRSFYSMAPGLIGAANAARRKALELLEAEVELRRTIIEHTIKDEDRKNMAIIALDGDTHAKRMAIAQQFPGFWNQQLRDLVASNTFAVSQIVSTWTGGLANAIVNGGNFIQAAWKSTQLAVVQGALNTGVQLAAQWALMATTQIGITAASAASIGAINAAKNSAIIAGDTAAAGATVGIWGGASTAILGFFGTIWAGIASLFTSLLAGIVAVGVFVMKVLTAIGTALGFTGVGAPLAGGILVGVAMIAAALAMAGAIKFGKGGLVTGPTLGMVGEKGPELIVPLDRLGSMGGGAKTIVVPVYLNGREIARAVVEDMPGAWHEAGLPA